MKMKAEVGNIKAVFLGNERFMRLTTYYRHNGYSPIYSLRSSISVLIQVPFFIAAYHFLSGLESIKGVAFGPIGDLAKPDGLASIRISGFGVKLLPLAVNAINWVSSTLYAKVY